MFLVIIILLLSTRLSMLATAVQQLHVIGRGETSSCKDKDPFRCSGQTCNDINGALEILETPPSTDLELLLDDSLHTICQTRVISKVDTLRFMSIHATNLEKANVTITCFSNDTNTVGIAFVRVRSLYFEHITISGCGFSGLEDLLEEYQITLLLERFIKFPNNTKIGLLIVLSENLTLNHTTVTNTAGIGLLGINVIKSATLESSVFSHNKSPEPCRDPLDMLYSNKVVEGLADAIGGGAYFLYINFTQKIFHDPNTLLNVINTVFDSNRDCGVTGWIELFVDFAPFLREIGYQVGAGGGLSLMLAQRDFGISVDIQHTVFQKNTGRFGAGAHIALFNGISNSGIRIINCTFDSNGLLGHMYNKSQDTKGGGGLMVFTDLKKAEGYANPEPYANKNTSLRIINSTFYNNSAFQGGGTFVYSLYYASKSVTTEDVVSIHFNNCTFSGNKGIIGSALEVYEKKFFGTDGGIKLVMTDISVRNNTTTFYKSSHLASTDDSSGAVDFQFMRVEFSGNVTFASNSGTALRLYRSYANITGHTSFHNNSGTLGGAIHLYSFGMIVIGENSSLSFRNNWATVRGGAIYAAHFRTGLTYIETDDCFLYFKDIGALTCSPNSCPNISNMGVNILFSGNRAPIGSIVYGSTLETCPWLKQYHNGSLSIKQLHKYFPTSVFDFGSDLPDGIRQVSTPPVHLTVGVDKEKYRVMPGEQFQLKVIAEDAFSQQVPGAITSAIVDAPDDQCRLNNTEQCALVGKSGYWYLNGDNASETPVVVYGKENQTIPVVLYTVDSFADVKLTVELQHCSQHGGFIYDDKKSSCVCSQLLKENKIDCNITEKGYRLFVPDRTWVGPVGKNLSELAVGICIFDYCRRGPKAVDTKAFDFQCAEGSHRTGILCSSCKAGYSLVLGSNRCMRCSGGYISLIIPFGAAGILLVVVVSILRISFSEGYLNGILFYCHIVNIFTCALAPRFRVNHAFIPIALLSLNLGFETCFYNGLSSLMRAFLRFIFPAYLFVLMGIIILLARVSRSLGSVEFSAAKTFSTLLFVCYTSVLEACIEILSFGYLNTLEGASFCYWHVDANVPCFQKWHGFLAFLSITLLLLYIVPLPFVLLFPSLAYRLKYVRNLKPIYDALWAPFKPKFRFWLGFRLLLRCVPFAFAYIVVEHPLNLFLLGAFLVSLLFIQLVIQPFKGTTRNIADSALILNVIFLVLGTLFFSNRIAVNSGTKLNTMQSAQDYFSMSLVLLAYIQFLGVFIHHLQLRFPRFRQCLSSVSKGFNPVLKYIAKTQEEDTPGREIEMDDSDLFYHGMDFDGADRDPELPARLYLVRRPNRSAAARRPGVRQSELSAPLNEEGTLQLTETSTAL